MRRLGADAVAAWPSGAAGRTVVAVCATGLAVGGTVAAAHAADDHARAVRSADPAVSAAVHRQAQAILAERPSTQEDELSRSAVRIALSQPRHVRKSPPPALTGPRLRGSRTERVPPPTPRQIAMELLPSYGWSSSQFSCLDAIWTRESNWNPYAKNPTSGAYGIPQALPGAKMSTYGSDWATNPVTQIKWGLWYIRASYGSPCGAWYFWQSHSWY